jgi:hypothetical protein
LAEVVAFAEIGQYTLVKHTDRIEGRDAQPVTSARCNAARSGVEHFAQPIWPTLSVRVYA